MTWILYFVIRQSVIRLSTCELENELNRQEHTHSVDIKVKATFL